MTARILSAKPVVEKMTGELRRRCDDLKSRGMDPSMSVVLVGDNPASLSYIRNKKRLCEEVGAKFTLHQLPENISEKDFLKKVSTLNHDPAVNGIIIQLPVSPHLRTLHIPDLVTPDKDIDGFHSENTKLIYEGSTSLKNLLPCTPKGIIHLLRFYDVDIEGKNIVVIGRSLIVGKPVSMMLSNLCATVTLAHSKTKDLRFYTKNADIVIVAVGKAHLLDQTHFDPNKKTVVIDVGMNSLDGKLVGDVNTQAVGEFVESISPVPGGVGPMTVLSLIENLIRACERQAKG